MADINCASIEHKETSKQLQPEAIKKLNFQISRDLYPMIYELNPMCGLIEQWCMILGCLLTRSSD